MTDTVWLALLIVALGAMFLGVLLAVAGMVAEVWRGR